MEKYENAQSSNISSHDKDVLTRIFNPNLPYGDTCEGEEPAQQEYGNCVLIKHDFEVNDWRPKMKFFHKFREKNQIVEVETDAIKEAKQLELDGVKQAEAGLVAEALELFNKAISVAPEHASSYNNRAQALRLHGDVQGALEDLNKCIQLCRGQGKVACQAYTQRGIIKRLEEDEDGAKEDLRNAANLGGQFARQLLVTMNPYAALCNQMLSDVMHKLRSGVDPDVE